MAWFKCGGGGIPASLKSDMNDVLNKKFGTVLQDYPPEDWPGTVNIMGPLEEKNVSGSIVAFSDGADAVLLKSCAVTIAPNLDGVSSVDVVQTGKNLINPDKYQASSNILTIGQNDGTSFDTFLKAGTYTISYTTTGDSCYIYRREENDVSNTNMGKRLSVTFTIESDGNFRFWLYGDGAVSANISNVQLEVGSTATAYEPYVTPTTHTANLGRTIYGGTVDVVNGTGTSTHGKVTLTAEMIDNAITYTYQGKIGVQIANVFPVNVIRQTDNLCYVDNGDNTGYFVPVRQGASSDADYMWFGSSSGNKYIYWIGVLDTMGMTLEQWKTWALTKTIICVYELPTPEDFTFTPVPIITRLGDNTLWGDGDLSVVYRSSGTQTIITPTLISKTVTENGTYSAEDDGADGYSSVTVNVPTGAANIETVLGENPLIEITGVSGTDVTRTLWTRTAAAAEKIVFHSNTQVRTNTGSNDGYFKVLKNDVVVVSTYANTSTTTPLSIPDIDLEAGDVLTISAGFDNSHTSCWFDLYSTITILSSGSTPVLSLGNPGPVNEPEQEETDAAPEEPEEIQEETPEEVDQNESNE